MKTFETLLKATAVVLIMATLISLVFLAPLAVIWALNTLFTLGIPYTIKTYVAVMILNLTWFYKPSLKFDVPQNKEK